MGINSRMGMYSNRTIYIDLENETYEEIDFNISELNPEKPLKVIETLKEKPTRLMFRILDQGLSYKRIKKRRS